MTSSNSRSEAARPKGLPRNISGASARLARIGSLPILVALAIIVFAWGNPRFLSEDNIINVSQQGVYLLIVALAQMLVLIAGGIRSLRWSEYGADEHHQRQSDGRGARRLPRYSLARRRGPASSRRSVSA